MLTIRNWFEKPMSWHVKIKVLKSSSSPSSKVSLLAQIIRQTNTPFCKHFLHKTNSLERVLLANTQQTTAVSAAPDAACTTYCCCATYIIITITITTSSSIYITIQDTCRPECCRDTKTSSGFSWIFSVSKTSKFLQSTSIYPSPISK